MSDYRCWAVANAEVLGQADFARETMLRLASAAMRKAYPSAVSVFFVPPVCDVCGGRLIGQLRGTTCEACWRFADE